MIGPQPGGSKSASGGTHEPVEQRIVAHRLTAGLPEERDQVSKPEAYQALLRLRNRSRRNCPWTDREAPALGRLALPQTKFAAVSDVTPETVTWVLSDSVKVTPPVTLVCEAMTSAAAVLA